MGSQKGIAGGIGSHLAITHDKMGQDGEHRFTSGALNAPNSETAEANASIMGVASQRTAAVTGRLVGELKPQGKDEGQDKLNERLAITQELRVGGLLVEIDGDRVVLSGRFGGLGHVSSPCGWQPVSMRHREDNFLKDQADCGRIGASPLNSVECEILQVLLLISIDLGRLE